MYHRPGLRLLFLSFSDCAGPGPCPGLGRMRSYRMAFLVGIGLALHFVLAVEATQRSVGDTWGWSRPPEISSSTYDDGYYQRWADGFSWLSGDVLYFDYNYPDHDLIVFPSESTFQQCDDGRNLLDGYNATLVSLLAGDPGTFYTVFFGTTDYLDCLDGMKFSLTYLTPGGPGDSPALEPPPPSGSGAPRPPPPSSRSRAPPPPPTVPTSKSKPSSNAGVIAGVLVPLLLILVGGAGVGVWCCKRRQSPGQQNPYPGASDQHIYPPGNVPNFIPNHQREQVFNGSRFV